MAIKDIASEIKIVQSLAPQVITTGTPTGTAVDVSGYNAVAVELNLGTQAGTSNSFRVEHSDVVGSGYAAVPDADIDPDTYTTNKAELVVTTSNDAAVQRFRYRGQKQFLRVIAFAATTGNLPCAASIVLGYPKEGPVAAWNV
jgi:hypothetical protein